MSQENIPGKQPLIRHVNRQQMSWRAVDVERLISEDHPARAIWALVGRLDLSAFYRAIESSTEEGGRPAFDPQMLISLWVYAYSQGIGSAREVARRKEPYQKRCFGTDPYCCISVSSKAKGTVTGVAQNHMIQSRALFSPLSARNPMNYR